MLFFLFQNFSFQDDGENNLTNLIRNRMVWAIRRQKGA